MKTLDEHVKEELEATLESHYIEIACMFTPEMMKDLERTVLNDIPDTISERIGEIIREWLDELVKS